MPFLPPIVAELARLQELPKEIPKVIRKNQTDCRERLKSFPWQLVFVDRTVCWLRVPGGTHLRRQPTANTITAATHHRNLSYISLCHALTYFQAQTVQDVPFTLQQLDMNDMLLSHLGFFWRGWSVAMLDSDASESLHITTSRKDSHRIEPRSLQSAETVPRPQNVLCG